MRKKICTAGAMAVVGIAGYLVGSTPSTDVATAAPPMRDLFYVERAVDGDTLKGYFVGEIQYEIRLLSVDTPERGEVYYKAATQVTADLVEGEVVALQFEKPHARDKYGRFLAYVYGPDGTNLNLRLVEKGMSTYYDKYGPGLFADDFVKAEHDAQVKKLGLWEE